MQYKGSYKGLNNVSKSGTHNRIKKLILLSVFLTTFITTIFIVTLKIENKVQNINLSKEEIQNYINISDELSKYGQQVNWQEIAAINSVLNNGNFIISNENISKIEKALFNEDNLGNIININDFEYILKNLELDRQDRELAMKNLEGLKNNYINENLLEDESKLEFIKSVSEISFNNYESYGILPSITIS